MDTQKILMLCLFVYALASTMLWLGTRFYLVIASENVEHLKSLYTSADNRAALDNEARHKVERELAAVQEQLKQYKRQVQEQQRQLHSILCAATGVPDGDKQPVITSTVSTGDVAVKFGKQGQHQE